MRLICRLISNAAKRYLYIAIRGILLYNIFGRLPALDRVCLLWLFVVIGKMEGVITTMSAREREKIAKNLEAIKQQIEERLGEQAKCQQEIKAETDKFKSSGVQEKLDRLAALRGEPSPEKAKKNQLKITELEKDESNLIEEQTKHNTTIEKLKKEQASICSKIRKLNNKKDEEETKLANLTHRVRFLGKYGECIEEQKIKHGLDAKPPSPPSLKDWEFEKWDWQCEAIMDDADIKAVYVYQPAHRVRFLGKDGEVIEEQKIKHGHDAKPPSPPSLKDWEFKKWDGQCEAIMDDADIKAVYRQVCFEATTPNPPKIGQILIHFVEGKMEVVETNGDFFKAKMIRTDYSTFRPVPARNPSTFRNSLIGSQFFRIG
jgi:hypothetical protein